MTDDEEALRTEAWLGNVLPGVPVLVACRAPVVCTACVAALRARGCVVETAGTVGELREKAETHHPAVIVGADLLSPRSTLLEDLASRSPATAVLVIGPAAALEWRTKGAFAVVSNPHKTTQELLDRVAAGVVWAHGWRDLEGRSSERSRAPPAVWGSPAVVDDWDARVDQVVEVFGLSSAKARVLRQLGRATHLNQAAQALGKSPSTLALHVRGLRAVLGGDTWKHLVERVADRTPEQLQRADKPSLVAMSAKVELATDGAVS